MEKLQSKVWEIIAVPIEDQDASRPDCFLQACLFVANQVITTTSSPVFARPAESADVRGIASLEDIPQNEFISVAKLTKAADIRLTGLFSVLKRLIHGRETDKEGNVIMKGERKEGPIEHVGAVVECLTTIGKYRPQYLERILDEFARHTGASMNVDPVILRCCRSLLSSALCGDFHARCVDVIKKIDPEASKVPMETIIALSRQSLLSTKAKKRAAAEHKFLLNDDLELELLNDGDALLGADNVVAVSQEEKNINKMVEPYTLMQLRLNPREAARACLSGISVIDSDFRKDMAAKDVNVRVTKLPDSMYDFNVDA